MVAWKSLLTASDLSKTCHLWNLWDCPCRVLRFEQQLKLGTWRIRLNLILVEECSSRQSHNRSVFCSNWIVVVERVAVHSFIRYHRALLYHHDMHQYIVASENGMRDRPFRLTSATIAKMSLQSSMLSIWLMGQQLPGSGNNKLLPHFRFFLSWD
ncbi:hypothetical protein Salat_1901100 [Sesamum alatum]|uniref:Uncharacterized protein n=1 Tax=Sesamum alatum TaxID=300844 RepID=A0AAE2CI94_9LAMI|nr:hypothetical protein Salat_1901100 [Sesamum alatum]